MAQIASHLLVAGLTRQAFAEGGSAVVIAKGDETAGAILVLMAQKGRICGLWERVRDRDARFVWAKISSQDTEKQQEFNNYMKRRQANDPDLWVIEVDVADAPRFAAQMPTGG